MIYINMKKANNLPLDINDFFIVFDYDRTITSCDSETSWGILEANKIVSKSYVEDSRKLYDYYRKIEIDNTIPDSIKSYLMEKWMNEQLCLLMNYGINEKVFNQLLECTYMMKFRDGIQGFFKEMRDFEVPIIIISAGLGNVVVKALKENNCLLDNVIVISNMLKFNHNLIEIDGKSVNSVSKTNIIVPSYFQKQIEKKDNLLLFGDQISDLSVAKNFNTLHKISVGFLSSDTKNDLEEYQKHFDVVASLDENFETLEKILVKKRK